MRLELAGKIRNTQLPKARPLLPLFEAVVNSFQSLEEAATASPHLRITAIRETTLDPGMSIAPIADFTIEDNGLGFDSSNFESFFTSDSLRKSSRGGRGIGRFLWLKAFERAEIESHFVGMDGSMRLRAFTFSVADNVPNDKTTPSNKTSATMIVKLIGLKDPYRKECPRRLEVVAQRLIEHCLPLFLNPKCPQVDLADDTVTLNLNDIFRQQFDVTAQAKEFHLEGESFRMRGFRLRNVIERNSKIVYAANYCEVLTEKLDRFISNLKGRLEDDKGGFYYLGFIESAFLDQHVMGERSGFSLQSGDDQDAATNDADALDSESSGQSDSMFIEITLRDIRAKALDYVREDLKHATQQYSAFKHVR